MLKTSAKKLEKAISNEKFLLRGDAFIKQKTIKFTSKKEATDFLINFLLVESIAGIHYSYKDISQNYRKIKKMVKKGKIDSEKIPVIAPKKHTDKVLSNVYYIVKDNICTYEKAC